VKRRELMLLLGSAAAGWPLAARAQQKAMPVIGFLSGVSPGYSAPLAAAFRQGLGETGYVDGKNVAIEYVWAEFQYGRLPALAADLVTHNVEVIATSGGILAALAAKHATSTIPIVFCGVGDPVGDGLVDSLNRPGNNMTGMSLLTAELIAKRLDLLSDLVPTAALIAMLVNPNSSTTERMVRDGQRAASVKGVQLQILRAGVEGEFETAFASLVHMRAGALLVGSDPFFSSRREQLVALAARYAVPAMYDWRDDAVAGGLISYGASLAASHRQAGIYAGRILKGAKPADLPVEQPTTFELVINLKTAMALGLTIPHAMLMRADEVIE
jgi:putative tryptophan/tyrosine transport system substrate-binding protein